MDIIALCLLVLWIVCCVFFLVQPSKYILTYLALAPIIEVFWFYEIFSFSVVELFSAIIPVLFISTFVTKALNSNWQNGKFGGFFLLYLIPSVLHVVLSIVEDRRVFGSLELFAKISVGFSCYYLFLNVFNYEDYKKLIRSILVAVCIIFMMMAIQIIFGVGQFGEKGAYFTGWYQNNAPYWQYPFFGIILVMPTILHDGNKLGKILFCLLCVTAMILAVSRSAILALMGVVWVYAIVQKNFAIPFIFVFIIVFLYVFSPTVQELYYAKLDREIEFIESDGTKNVDQLGSGRIGIWRETIERFERGTLFQQVFGTGRGIGPHGEAFGILQQFGVFGIFITIVFFFRVFLFVFKEAIPSRNNPPGVYALLFIVTTALLGLTASSLQNFYLQGITFAFVAIAEKKPKTALFFYLPQTAENNIDLKTQS